MSRHSKRNTASSFFTTFERSLLKKDYGTLKGRLGASSFRPFDACKLCLSRSRDPVVCPSHGDIFCRECIMENLLVQRQEIKRFEKEQETKRKEEEENEVLADEEVKERAVRDFELVQMGLSLSKPGLVGNVVGRRDGKVIVEKEETGKGKRKFELDEEELIRIAREDREKAKKALTEEKVLKSVLIMLTFLACCVKERGFEFLGAVIDSINRTIRTIFNRKKDIPSMSCVGP
jgi:nitric oxide synthase-interacting protein